MDLDDLVHEEGKPNSPGQSTIIYGIFSTSKSAAMVLDEDRNVTSVPLVESVTWKKQYGTDGTIEIKDTMEGENDCRSWTSQLSFFYPGNKAAALKHFGNWTNSAGYLITRDCATGEERILGTDCRPARMTVAEITSGGDKRGCTITFESKGNGYPAYVYTGTSPSETGSGSGAA